MKRYELKFLNGETGTLRQLDNGSFACPICGEPWREPPYWPNDGQLGPVHDVSSPSFGDVCECGVEFGVDEGIGDNAPIGAMARQWATFRIAWLDRHGWAQALLAQLRDHLELSEEQVRREAEVLRGYAWPNPQHLL